MRHMRKAQKQEILECLKSLRQAHEEIRGVLGKRNSGSLQSTRQLQSVLKMLGECQEFAVSIGETIEKLEGEEHVTVSFLEEYCELLFHVYEEIGGQCNGNDGGKGNGDGERNRNNNNRDTSIGGRIFTNENRVYKKLQQQLTKIENSVRNDIQIKKEVVFLPYKASMWDSMESVWMAAREDESCDAYVVAIPYYEKNPDGSLGQMHYEECEYPDYVPIVDWKTYDMETSRPDVVCIQNPYDDCNYVTCVHPQYFSRELKKYTDMLVYLPYFVGIGDSVPEHFCTTPGVAHADRVIVQSEEVKKVYIESIRKYEKENNCKGFFGNPDKKILPLGSPKLDRIKRVMDSGEVDIPEEWKPKIFRADGQKKKIVLYNTTIDALLKHSDTYMGKLKSVLDIFKQEKDFVLLWRPHPLLAATIKSLRPDLYQEYRGIAEKYRKEGWGIYDETADIDRAIVLSDAYYGDMSSVVELYKVTGKPIMIQDSEAFFA